VAEQANAPEQRICLLHEQRVEHRDGQLDVPEVTRTLEVG
jgi:hypothetical protein